MEPIRFRPEGEKGLTGRLHELTKSSPLSSKLKLVHAALRQRFDFVDRVAIALFDPDSSYLKNFVSSNEIEKDPLEKYQFPLKDALSLMESLVKGPRVVNDLSVFSTGLHEHTRRIREQGYRASYTIPILIDDAFWGFIFMNSHRRNCLTENVLQDLDLYGHIITATVVQWLQTRTILQNALKSTVDLMRVRNQAAGVHTDRVRHISRWIAEELAATGRYSFDEDWIENLSNFSAIHDVGMMSVPDSILLKPGTLDDQEFALITNHVGKGLEMIDATLSHFGLQSITGIEVLRNIVFYHHEKVDGSGYPLGLQGKDIPIEARIVQVAEIYDALTSARPYRPAYSNREALDLLLKQARKLDEDCLAAFVRCWERIDSPDSLP
jgi:HD-GYP domain-containing protein (c-di-GMP phosphodiesterase class II)